MAYLIVNYYNRILEYKARTSPRSTSDKCKLYIYYITTTIEAAIGVVRNPNA